MAYGILKVDNITFDNGGSDQNVTVSGLYRATTSGVTLSGTIAATTVSGVTVIGSTTVSGATVTGTTANFTSGNFSNIISSAATMSGALIMANQQQVRFREAVGNGVNHIALQAPAIVSADQTITLPDQTGTVVTTGDNGSVTSTMILDGTILNVDINASAAIAGTKISPDFGSQTIVTTGVHSAAAGSATTPSIAFTGDLNTGIYSPGADQVAISTNGTGRLFVDASGNVGIGAPNPSALLDLRGSTSTRINFGVTGAASRAFLDYTESGFLTTLDADGDIRFSPNNTEAVRITTAGRVGIGTSSPGALFDATQNANAVSQQIRLTNVNTVGTVGSAIKFQGFYDTALISSDGVPGAFTGGDLRLQTYSSNGVLNTGINITRTGLVGIGTTSPQNLLSTGSGASGQLGLSIDWTGGGGPYQVAGLTADHGTGEIRHFAFTNYYHTFYSNNTERLRIDSSGRVGIGTSSPGEKLHILTSSNKDVRIANASHNTLTTGLSSAITFSRASDGTADLSALFGWNNGGVVLAAREEIVFANGGSTTYSATAERLRIDSSGRVGIGTTSPSQLLTLNGNLFVGSSFNGQAIGDASAERIRIGYKDGAPDTGLVPAQIITDASILSIAARDTAASAIRFHTGTGVAERLRIDSSGRVGIGTSSPAGALDVRTAGSAFQAYVGTNSGTSANDAGIVFQNVPSATASSRSCNLYFDANGADGSGGDYLYISNTGDNVASIWNQGGGPIVFGRVSTESLRIDSSGRLLVGTSSARSNFFDSTFSAQIQVEGSDSSNTAISQVRFLNDASGPYHILAKTRSASSGGTTIVNSDDVLGVVSFQGADGSEFVEAASITCRVDGTPGANDMPGRLVFSTTADGAASPTERFRIDNAGQVLIGTTTFGSAGTSFSPIGAQVLYNNNTADTGVSLWCLSARPADTGRQFLYFQANTAVSPTVVFQVLNNGNTQNANGSFTSISDARLKENIVDSNSQWNDIKAIKIRNWNFKAETGLETHQQIGPVAQELELVCPGLVFEIFDRDADGNNLETATKGVNQSVLYMKAIKALQEAIARIETLEAAVAALQSA